MRTKSFFLFLTAVFFILAAVRVNAQPVVNQNDIKFESSSVATLVGQDGLIMRTEDGGLNWNVLNSGITNVLNSNDMYKYTDELGIEHTVLYAAGENGIILSSLDNGLSWNLVVSGTIEHLNKIMIRSANEMYVCGNNGTVLISLDNGLNWQPAVTNVTTDLNSIALAGLDGTLIDVKAVAVGDNGTVIISRDYGFTWETVVSGVNTDLNAVIYTGGTSFVAVGNDGTIIKSVDAGITWSIIASPSSFSLYDVKYIYDESKSILLASGENGTIISSSDMGDGWKTMPTPTESDLYAINFGNVNYGISTGSSGTEIYTTDGGETWLASLITDRAGDRKSDLVKLSQNYPNPFNPSTMINYSIGDNSTVSIKIYDMTGREVRTLVNSYQAPGSYSVKFDAVNLSSGIYFYVLRANTGKNEITKTMRMILTK